MGGVKKPIEEGKPEGGKTVIRRRRRRARRMADPRTGNTALSQDERKRLAEPEGTISRATKKQPRDNGDKPLWSLKYIDPGELLPHPVNAEIYGDGDPPKSLVKSIREHGIL